MGAERWARSLAPMFSRRAAACTLRHDRAVSQHIHGRAMKLGLSLTVAWLVGASAAASAQTGAGIFRDADFALGERLMKEHRCEECHRDKVGGDGSAIYRPSGRISTAGFLRGMVEQCNTELNLGLFPEEVTAVAAVLNRDRYRFK